MKTKNETILEGNKILAEFDGLKEDILFREVDKERQEKGLPACGPMYVLPSGDISSLDYHITWDGWLMNIVEKIERIHDDYQGRFGVHISSNTCTIQSTNFRPDKRIPEVPHYFNSYTLEDKKESTWHACVSFVKWYNDYKKNK